MVVSITKTSRGDSSVVDSSVQKDEFDRIMRNAGIDPKMLWPVEQEDALDQIRKVVDQVDNAKKAPSRALERGDTVAQALKNLSQDRALERGDAVIQAIKQLNQNRALKRGGAIVQALKQLNQDRAFEQGDAVAQAIKQLSQNRTAMAQLSDLLDRNQN